MDDVSPLPEAGIAEPVPVVDSAAPETSFGTSAFRPESAFGVDPLAIPLVETGRAFGSSDSADDVRVLVEGSAEPGSEASSGVCVDDDSEGFAESELVI